MNKLFILSAALLFCLNQAQAQKKLKITGNTSAGFSYYDANSPLLRQLPYGYNLSLFTSLSYGQFSLPLSFTFNESGSQFNNPFTRYGISPSYKWATLHLGYRNLRYSEFSLNGVTSLGAGLSLTPGKFRIEAMYGQFRRASDQITDNYQIPQFERRGYAGKVGFGKKSKLNLIFFHAEDDVNSISLNDSLKRAIEPKNNTILGLENDIHFWKNKIILRTDLGLCINTEDKNADKIDNSTLEEFVPSGLINYLDLNVSSNAAFAGKTQLVFNFGKFSINALYRYVQDQYQSLGLNYLLDDIQQITINPSLVMLKGKLNFSGSFGLEKNNLSGRREDVTQRYIGAGNLFVLLSKKVNLNLSYSSFSVNQQIITDNLLLSDSLFLDQFTQNFGLVSNVNLSNNDISRQIIFNINYQILDDRNPTTSQFNNNNMINFQTNYMNQYKKSGFGYNVGVLFTNFFTQSNEFLRYGLNGTLSKSLVEKLSLSTRAFYFINQVNNTNGSVSGLTLTVNYNPFKKHTLLVNGSLIDNRGTSEIRETRANIQYNFTF